jgi:nitrite reductase (NADH) small subunit
LALFHVAGDFFVLDGVCPHQGGPLGKGSLCDHIVTCPWHGWQFDVRTGANQITATIRQPRIHVRRRGDELVVRRADLADDDPACE